MTQDSLDPTVTRGAEGVVDLGFPKNTMAPLGHGLNLGVTGVYFTKDPPLYLRNTNCMCIYVG